MKKHLMATGIVVLLLVVGLSGCVDTTENKPTQPYQPPIQHKSWKYVDSWVGSDDLTTNQFSISGDKIKIDWDYDYGSYVGFDCVLYESGGKLTEIVFDANRYSKGYEEYSINAGDYYLKINSANTIWIVKVYEWR